MLLSIELACLTGMGGFLMVLLACPDSLSAGKQGIVGVG